MARPQVPDRLKEEVESVHEQYREYPAGVFQEALRTVTDLAKTSLESEPTTEDRNTEMKEVDLAGEMYNGLAAVEEGGSLYTLNRDSPFQVEHVDRKSSVDGGGKARVYLEGPQGGQYRLVADSETDTLLIENKSSGEWETHSTRVKSFRYRSPSHPENGDDWEYRST